jgi:toxin ParE1/3/4
MGRFVLRPRAVSDLDGIWEYSVEHWGVEQAKRYTNDIRAIIEKVAENPKLGWSCGGGHFKVLTGSHAIIYRLLDDGIGVERILHQRMDMPRHF